MKFTNVKKYALIATMIIFTFIIFACKKDVIINQSNTIPNVEKMSGEYNLDFDYMFDSIIETINRDNIPEYDYFFFIKNGGFEVTGDNEKKVISINCTCLDKTIQHDLDLFLSLVLNLIGLNASEQDFRFERPTVDYNDENVYTDFGGVFNTYDLIIDAKTDNGTVLRNDYIKAKERIPIESRYWSE